MIIKDKLDRACVALDAIVSGKPAQARSFVKNFTFTGEIYLDKPLASLRRSNHAFSKNSRASDIAGDDGDRFRGRDRHVGTLTGTQGLDLLALHQPPATPMIHADCIRYFLE